VALGLILKSSFLALTWLSNLKPVDDILGPTWSLCVEAHFYFGLPILLLILHKRRKLLFVAMVAIGVLSISLRTFLLTDAGCRFVENLRLPVVVGHYSFTLARLDQLLFGAAAAVLEQAGVGKSFTGRLNSSAFVFGLLLFVPVYSVLFPGLIGYWSGFLFIGLLFPLLFLVLARATEEKTLARRFLCSRPLQWVGARSYGLYVYHMVVLAFGSYLWPAANPFVNPNADPVHAFILRCASLLALLFVGAVSFRWIEQPFLKRRASK